MCGINGVIVHRGQAPADLAAMRRTRDHMAARGPDGFGEWVDADGRIAFGHRRLSIIDLSGGAQPMADASGALVVTFNGEIYNFQALRDELAAQGAAFRTHSDTEVLLELYRRDGAAMLSRLRGMFAFALWDAAKRTLLLARDPYGIKPLYYSDDGKALRFASSVKALFASGEIDDAPCPAGVAGFRLFGSVPEPWTFVRAIKSVPAGSYLVVDDRGAGAPQRFFSLAQTYVDAERRPLVDTKEAFRAAALSSVKHHLVADVPVGAFLSAGVDSGALVGLMRDAGVKDIRTVTLAYRAFAGTARDESPLAEKVAERYGASHFTRVVDQDEFRADLPKILAAMDQPSIDGVNTWFVAKAARELGLKVAISGIGGDELLGGYSTFSRLPAWVRRLRFAPRGLAGVAIWARRLGAPLHPKLPGLLALGRDLPGAYLVQRALTTPDALRRGADDGGFTARGLEELDALGMVRRALIPEPTTDFAKVAVLESSFYLRNQLLRDSDWAGMAHSLEIRTPLVDAQMLADVAPIFARSKPPSGKSLLAGAPSLALPDEVLNRPKTGFGIPVADWLRDGGAADAWETRVAQAFALSP